ncbi:MAG: alcohol dehydrogenase catalytic domain-containing protein [Sedimentisphaerales bacterium]|nr:alcohol dehydrogenase catalytic domain-containing protein [Sedimentisphaerales bacterium]
MKSSGAKTQYAVQLVGPDKLILNKSKEVFKPGPHQILGRVEAVGLCFSDLKLLKQFAAHVRKGEILSGIDTVILKQIPSYVPGDLPTVPGHEASVIIEAVGPGVKDFKPGERYLVQTDYRWLCTAGSNAAFGYNFEGALQEYVLMDNRVITSPQGESLLIPVSMGLSASAVALVEPWACVEDAYASKERRSIKEGGQMLVVIDSQVNEGTFKAFLSRYGRPRYITWLDKFEISYPSDVPVKVTANVYELPDAGYDDVIYFGCEPAAVEKLFSKVAPQGLLNIVLCGGKFKRDVETAVGRVHYGGIRIIGTAGCDPSESMEIIPQTGEIRPGDKINVIGAAGPMGLMHVVRNICQGVKGVSVFAGDVDDNRLAFLTRIAAPLADKNGVQYQWYNPKKQRIGQAFDYTVLMAPVPDLVAAAVRDASKRGIINIFAGIPAAVTAKIDLDSYIEKKVFFIGTSGSTLDDMKRMLAKVESGRLDTNVSVAAICGLDGAADGIRAVENRSIPGKIMVYPACRGLGLVTLKEMDKILPEVAANLNNGLWTKQAEKKLLEKYGKRGAK